MHCRWSHSHNWTHERARRPDGVPRVPRQGPRVTRARRHRRHVLTPAARFRRAAVACISAADYTCSIGLRGLALGSHVRVLREGRQAPQASCSWRDRSSGRGDDNHRPGAGRCAWCCPPALLVYGTRNSVLGVRSCPRVLPSDSTIDYRTDFAFPTFQFTRYLKL